jgi:transposase
MEAMVICDAFASFASQCPLLHLDAWHMDNTATQLALRVTSMQALVHCPICRFPTRRVHSRYVRMVADLPWGPWRVVRHLQVRKFFCANGRCTRRTFPERLLTGGSSILS